MATLESSPEGRRVEVSGFGRPELTALLHLPEAAVGLVVVADPACPAARAGRCEKVAAALRAAGFATLRLNLASAAAEPAAAGLQVDALVDRLVAATEWILQDPETQPLNIGYWSTDLGAAAALIAAAQAPDHVDAVVSIAGDPELAGHQLEKVRAATLLVIGDADRSRLTGNRRAFDRLWKDKSLETITEAADLFDDPRALALVGDLSARWFNRHLRAGFHSAPSG
jgi:putative phosphoribosyl transferase